MLLEFAGRVKVGRKPELLQRALSLIDKGCPTSIVVKINDLNRWVLLVYLLLIYFYILTNVIPGLKTHRLSLTRY